jgi:coproporphyrinogen III oxidase
MNIDLARSYFLGLQDRIIDALQVESGEAFVSDAWVREPGGTLEGDGCSRLIEGGALLERGGCNFSHVKGRALPPSATQHRVELAGAPFEAMGVSLVFHPHNPYVPTVHMNVRLLAALPVGRETVVWFGGGMDLTPYYGFEDDARHFHAVNRAALAPFGADKYPRFKRWCDEYFFLKHRNEPRGIGGVFFDDFSELGFDDSFAMRCSMPTCRSCGADATRRSASASAISRPIGAGVMWSSTWCSIAARCSDCNRAGALKAS